MSKEFRFFTYLIESYANHKGVSTSDVLKSLDEKDLTDFVYNMYELYHVEAIENAFRDIDRIVNEAKK